MNCLQGFTGLVQDELSRVQQALLNSSYALSCGTIGFSSATERDNMQTVFKIVARCGEINAGEAKKKIQAFMKFLMATTALKTTTGKSLALGPSLAEQARNDTNRAIFTTLSREVRALKTTATAHGKVATECTDMPPVYQDAWDRCEAWTQHMSSEIRRLTEDPLSKMEEYNLGGSGTANVWHASFADGTWKDFCDLAEGTLLSIDIREMTKNHEVVVAAVKDDTEILGLRQTAATDSTAWTRAATAVAANHAIICSHKLLTSYTTENAMARRSSTRAEVNNLKSLSLAPTVLPNMLQSRVKRALKAEDLD
jgi:hypothetical protein